jgi:outer membrane protein assembly factor BamB
VLKWSYKTGDYVDSSPALGKDGTIYFGCDDKIFYALTPQGKLKWKYKVNDEIYSSPAIAKDGTVYFGCDDGNLYALNSEGKLKWKYQVDTEIYSSPTIASDDTIFFGADLFYALNSEGKLKWSFDTGNFVDSSAAISPDGTIYFGDANYDEYKGRLYALQDQLSIKNIMAPASGTLGGQITVPYTIINQGAKAVDDIIIKFYLTPTPSLSGVKYYLGQSIIDSLGPGESKNQETVFNIPYVPVDSYYIAALVNNQIEGFSNTTITIREENPSPHDVTGKTVGMLKTGTSLIALLVAFLLLSGGMLFTKMKQK